MYKRKIHRTISLEKNKHERFCYFFSLFRLYKSIFRLNIKGKAIADAEFKHMLWVGRRSWNLVMQVINYLIQLF